MNSGRSSWTWSIRIAEGAELPKVTFSYLDDVVPFRIRGEGGKDYKLPEDGGLVSRFLQWTMKERIYNVLPAGFSGPGDYMGFFAKDHIPKIRAWLQENGVVEDDKKTWERRND